MESLKYPETFSLWTGAKIYFHLVDILEGQNEIYFGAWFSVRRMNI